MAAATGITLPTHRLPEDCAVWVAFDPAPAAGVTLGTGGVVGLAGVVVDGVGVAGVTGGDGTGTPTAATGNADQYSHGKKDRI
jgi:hypothetical protein